MIRNGSTVRCAAKTAAIAATDSSSITTIPVANGGLSSYDNLKFKCGPDHWAKTERDRKAGLLGGPQGERAPPR